MNEIIGLFLDNLQKMVLEFLTLGLIYFYVAQINLVESNFQNLPLFMKNIEYFSYLKLYYKFSYQIGLAVAVVFSFTIILTSNRLVLFVFKLLFFFKLCFLVHDGIILSTGRKTEILLLATITNVINLKQIEEKTRIINSYLK